LKPPAPLVLGVSIDAQPAKAAWATSLGPVSYDLLSDFHPHGQVAQQYGVFRPKEGFSERAVFVIDRDGKIAWSRLYDIPELPGHEELFAALENLT
jgi:peroxiredoxin